MDKNKWKMLMKTFIISKLSYYLSVWMLHRRNTESRVSKVHERSLRWDYDDNPYLSFDELLIKEKLVSIHQRNLQFLASEELVVYWITGLKEKIKPNFH